jgi:A nuclease family of the HNH/ENDO VII superfamily with conserved AHH
MSSWKYTTRQPPGYQRHHLIPVNIMRSAAFAKLFGLIAHAGFNPHCFLNNGFLLPATENESEQTGLPLHRGPHREYDELVAERLNIIWVAVLTGKIAANPISIMTHISDLQGQIRRNLGPNAWIRLNQHDPRHVQSQPFLHDEWIEQINWAQLLA